MKQKIDNISTSLIAHDQSETIDSIHLANVITDRTVALPPLVSIDDMRANGARLITPGFNISNSNVKYVTWTQRVCKPTLK